MDELKKKHDKETEKKKLGVAYISSTDLKPEDIVSRGEVLEMIQYLDANLTTKPNYRGKSIHNFKKMAKYLKSNKAYVDERYKQKFEKFREAFKEYFRSYSGIRIEREYYKYIEFMEKNSIIIDMIDRKAKDYEFKE